MEKGGFLSDSPNNPRFVQIVWRHFQFYPIASDKADPPFAHLAANRGEHEVFVVQLDAKHRAGKDRMDAALDFNMFFFHCF